MLDSTEATDVQTFAAFLVAEEVTAREEQDAAREALIRLVERSHAVLGAGLSGSEVEMAWAELYDVDVDEFGGPDVETLQVSGEIL